MSKVTPSLPKGTRDFGPDELRKRNYIFGVIRNVFEKYGFQPIETPVMENLSTLEGKYGEEGDKLLFRILNSGDFLKEVRNQKLGVSEENLKKITSLIAEKGLRYDLTIPFARYVVQHQHEITFPFKRYQIQPVWRADRPQKGRYREFYQCDADVIGSDSLLNEVELILIYDEVFKKLGVDVGIKFSHRKVVTGIATFLGVPDKAREVGGALDKLDRADKKTVFDDLVKEGVIEGNLQLLDFVFEKKFERLTGIKEPFLHFFSILERKIDDPSRTIRQISDEDKDAADKFQDTREAINDLVQIRSLTAAVSKDSPLEFDIKLARGLDYYTGTIFEVKANNVQMGSIGGGGRYDNLTGVFGLPGVSGVGISFGVERIYDVMEELELFDNIDLQYNATRALFINFGGEAETKSFQYLQQLRASDIPAEIYPSAEKMKKQIGYADKKGIPYAIFVGEEEIKNNTLQIKNLRTGDQDQHNIEEVIELLKK